MTTSMHMWIGVCLCSGGEPVADPSVLHMAALSWKCRTIGPSLGEAPGSRCWRRNCWFHFLSNPPWAGPDSLQAHGEAASHLHTFIDKYAGYLTSCCMIKVGGKRDREEAERQCEREQLMLAIHTKMQMEEVLQSPQCRNTYTYIHTNRCIYKKVTTWKNTKWKSSHCVDISGIIQANVYFWILIIVAL